MLKSVDDCLGSIAHFQLRQNIGHMRLDRFQGNKELISNPLVFIALG